MSFQMITQHQNPRRWVSLFILLLVITAFLVLPNKASAQSTPEAAEAASHRLKLEQKLKSIVLDKINFDKADIATVIEFLSQKSRELDPDRQGINFVLRLPDKKDELTHIHREFTINLTNIPLASVLQYISDQTNLQCSVQEYAVYLHSATDEPDNLTTRTFVVPAGIFKPGTSTNGLPTQ